MSPDTISEWWGAAVALVGAIGVAWGWFKWALPKLRRAGTVTRKITLTMIGDDALVDPLTGKEVRPAVPGLGDRVGSLEDTVRLLADQHLRIQDHELRITALEIAATTPTEVKAEVTIKADDTDAA